MTAEPTQQEIRGALPEERDSEGHRVVGLTKILAETQEAGNIEVLRLDDINIDKLYQRDLNNDRIQRISDNWDMKAAGAILVSRRENGSLWVVDGGHRMGAAMMAGETEILAQVLVGLTPKEEAEYRLRANYRRPDTPQERFRAQLVAEHAETVEINGIVERHGAKVNFSPNSNAGINAVATLEEIFRRDHTGVLLARTLEFVTDTFGQVSGPTAVTPLLKGVAFMLDRHGPELNRGRMIEKLKLEGVTGVKRKAKNHQVINGGSLWLNVYRACVEVYNERLGDAAKLEARTSGWTKQGFTGGGFVQNAT
jgi:hypothetical protein